MIGGLGQTQFDQFGMPVPSLVPSGAAVSSPGDGLFALGPSSWSGLEWGILLIGGYVLYSVLSTTKRGVGRVTGAYSGYKKRQARYHRAAAEMYE